MELFSRRIFLKSVVAASAGFLGWLTLDIFNKGKASAEKKTITIGLDKDLPDGFSFFGDYIVYKSNNKLNVLSSKCTHLGCQINRAEGDELVCPCHGSRFGPDGRVLSGPAARRLEKLDFRVVEG